MAGIFISIEAPEPDDYRIDDDDPPERRLGLIARTHGCSCCSSDEILPATQAGLDRLDAHIRSLQQAVADATALRRTLLKTIRRLR